MLLTSQEGRLIVCWIMYLQGETLSALRLDEVSHDFDNATA